MNINTLVNVKLTEDGYNYYLKWLSQFPNQGIPTKEETLKLPLWELMQIFGSELYNGQIKMFFEGNNIDVEKE